MKSMCKAFVCFLFCYSIITGALYDAAAERRVRQAKIETLAKVIINLPPDILTSIKMEDL